MNKKDKKIEVRRRIMTLLTGLVVLNKKIIKYVAMKRVEAFIAAEKTDKVVSALEALNLQATFYESKGMGKGEKYRLSYGRGAGTTKMSYSERNTVVTIVEENRVGAVVAAIRREAAKTDKTSAGIIVISAVEDILSI
jgi:nitrogen regulatory protein PII